MSRRRRSRRGVSLGTVVMLLLTIVVLGGFCALLPRLTGTTDVRTNAAELAVAIDQSLSQIAASGVSLVGPTPQASVLPPSELATATPTPAAPTEPPEQRFSLCAAGSIQINSNVQKALTDDDTYRFDILFGDLAGEHRHAGKQRDCQREAERFQHSRRRARASSRDGRQRLVSGILRRAQRRRLRAC